jgi:hypothetical protein
MLIADPDKGAKSDADDDRRKPGEKKARGR